MKQGFPGIKKSVPENLKIKGDNVFRLRYAHSAMVEAESTRDDLRTSRSDLIKAKEILNDRETENQQLKIVIGKTR